MAAVQETVDRVRSIEVDAYKYGFISPIESDLAPKGLSEDTVRFISQKKDEPEWLLDWRLEAFRRWQTMEEPKWARVSYPPIDYQDIYYFAAPKSGAGAEVARRGRPGAVANLRQARHPAGRAGGSGWRREAQGGGRRRLRFGFDRDDLQGGARQGRASSSAPSPRRSEIIPTSCAAISARSCRARTTSTRRSIRLCSPTARSSMCRRACAARWSSRPISASTSGTPASLSARSSSPTGAPTSAISKAAPRRSGTRTSCTRPSSNSSRSMTRRSNTRRCRTGIRAIPRVAAASTIS